ncbi:hypothetical protein BC940DRAFT_306900 [Gongronella butleri]|nr:hypothetical protein BC940DRAFT_306900 [Gongronella butleri]
MPGAVASKTAQTLPSSSMVFSFGVNGNGLRAWSTLILDQIISGDSPCVNHATWLIPGCRSTTSSSPTRKDGSLPFSVLVTVTRFALHTDAAINTKKKQNWANCIVFSLDKIKELQWSRGSVRPHQLFMLFSAHLCVSPPDMPLERHKISLSR